MSNDILIEEFDNNELILRLGRKIDENSKFEEVIDILEEKTASVVYLKCSELKYMNSAGIRSLVDFVERICQSVPKFIYLQCSTILVSQFNMVKGFFPPNTSVESFYCPYFNPATDEEKHILILSKDIENNEAPIITDQDGNDLEFDGFPEKYFQFLKNF